MTDLGELLQTTARRAADYRKRAADVAVFPDIDVPAMRAALGDLPEGPTDAAVVVRELADIVEPAAVASTGPRYFGFVIGGALDAATAADVLTTAWDQNGYNSTTSPAAAVVEDVTGGWLEEGLGLPPPASGGVAAGGPGAHTGGLRGARPHVLGPGGWG